LVRGPHEKENSKVIKKHQIVSDPAEIDRILSMTNIGRMATIGEDGYPYITPVNFVKVDERFYFHCAIKGEKLDNIERDPRVCFEVDVPLALVDSGLLAGLEECAREEVPVCHMNQLHYSVIVRGKAAVVTDDDVKTAVLNALVHKHEPDLQFEPITRDLEAYEACHVVEITPESVTARRDVAQNKPEDVRRNAADYYRRRGAPGDHETVRAMGFEVDE
jgi:nitroimidazol reductase NimA-like FMN-containing flavoprotein (pyridoxamine 5'-phosphate oxidase superfamily)